MKTVKIIFYYLIFSLLALGPLSARVDHLVENQPIAFEEALTFSNQGVLKQKENGFIYLDVSNEFITSIVPLLEMPGDLRKRPTASRSIGAHVSVFHEMDNIIPEELGMVFTFDVKDIRSFTLHTRDGLKKLWVIAVDSPDLEALRVKYGCSPKLKGYDYHISIGKQLPTAPAEWEMVESLSPYNFSEEPVLDLRTEGDFVTVEHGEMLDLVQRVDAVGQLRLKSNGFVYVEVNNDFIEGVMDLLPTEGEFNPVSTKPKRMGAHISVMYEDEMIGHEIWNLEEAGQWFTFEVKELRYVSRGGSRLWFLAVDAPALQRLRTHHGLKPKLKGHDFHITIGSEKTEVIRSIFDDCVDSDPAHIKKEPF